MKLSNPHTLIIVTGGPGTGKSYGARQIASRLDEITFISYDAIKEADWDRFGFDNMRQKERLGWFSLEEFYLTVQLNMWEGRTILIEYPFYQRHKEKLRELLDEYHYQAITLLFYGDWKVIYERRQRRDHKDARHPGHLTCRYHKGVPVRPEDMLPASSTTYEGFLAEIGHKNYDIGLGDTIRVDVTDLSEVSYAEILASICKISEETAQ